MTQALTLVLERSDRHLFRLECAEAARARQCRVERNTWHGDGRLQALSSTEQNRLASGIVGGDADHASIYM